MARPYPRGDAPASRIRHANVAIHAAIRGPWRHDSTPADAPAARPGIDRHVSCRPKPVPRGRGGRRRDGDTADIRLQSGMVRVRLHAIDAPERDQPKGAASKAALSKLIYGKGVKLEPIEQDRYDRLVRGCGSMDSTSTPRCSVGTGLGVSALRR